MKHLLFSFFSIIATVVSPSPGLIFNPANSPCCSEKAKLGAIYLYENVLMVCNEEIMEACKRWRETQNLLKRKGNAQEPEEKDDGFGEPDKAEETTEELEASESNQSVEIMITSSEMEGGEESLINGAPLTSSVRGGLNLSNENTDKIRLILKKEETEMNAEIRKSSQKKDILLYQLSRSPAYLSGLTSGIAGGMARMAARRAVGVQIGAAAAAGIGGGAAIGVTTTVVLYLVPWERVPQYLCEVYYENNARKESKRRNVDIDQILQEDIEEKFQTCFSHLDLKKQAAIMKKWTEQDEKDLKKWIKSSREQFPARMIPLNSAFFMYSTDGYYRDVNNAVQEKEDKEGGETYYHFIKNVFEMMNYLNTRGYAYSGGTLWRGMILGNSKDENIKRLNETLNNKDHFLWGGFVSSSEEINQALNFTLVRDSNFDKVKDESGNYVLAEGAVLFKINVKPKFFHTLSWAVSLAIRIKHASKYEDEEEVLFAPFSKFWVNDISEMDIPSECKIDKKKINLVTLTTFGRWVPPLHYSNYLKEFQ